MATKTKKLTAKRRKQLADKWGFTESDLAFVLMPDIDGEDDDAFEGLDELATNSGYIWSFRLLLWFDKNQGQLYGDREDFDLLLDEIRDEKERK